jgi:putative flippase GtrA
MDSLARKRFVRYSLVGGGTFLFDLLLLFIFTDYLGINYVVAAGVAFLIAVSLNYIISRTIVFRGTQRTYAVGYVNFLLMAGVGITFVTGGMYVMVQFFAVPYVLARIAVAGMTGVFNYLFNLYVNFKVVGKSL